MCFFTRRIGTGLFYPRKSLNRHVPVCTDVYYFETALLRTVLANGFELSPVTYTTSPPLSLFFSFCFCSVLMSSFFFSWGFGEVGALGHGNEDDCSLPKKVDLSRRGVTKVCSLFYVFLLYCAIDRMFFSHVQPRQAMQRRDANQRLLLSPCPAVVWIYKIPCLCRCLVFLHSVLCRGNEMTSAEMPNLALFS